MIFYGTVKNGVLKLFRKDIYEMYLGTLENKDITLELKKRSRKRTNKANRYYWAILTLIGKDLGYYPEEIHNSFKALFLTDRTKKIPIVKSTTRLSTEEFTEYIERISQKMAEIGIIIQTPEEYYNNYKI